MKEVTQVNATMITLDCPHCGANQEGFLSDPRGGIFQCEECAEYYLVSGQSDVVLR